jgi:ABC-type branched-subunit amino acid transport system substrate-binding protein
MDVPMNRRGFAGSIFGLGSSILLNGCEVWAKAEPSKSIVLGQTYDGGRAELALISRVQKSYFESINAAGGIRDRKVQLVVLDDHGDIERARANLQELTGQYQALALFGMPKSSLSEAVPLPQLFVRDRLASVGSSKPMGGVVGFYPNYGLEGILLANLIEAHTLSPRIAVLLGQDTADSQLLAGVRNGLSPESAITKVQVSGPDATALYVALQTLKVSDANVLLIAVSQKSTLQALAALSDCHWKVRTVVGSESAPVLRSAPFALRAMYSETESVRYILDATDPTWSNRKPLHFAEFSRWNNNRGVQAYTRFAKHHAAGVDIKSEPAEFAYTTAQLMVQVLIQCRERLTRENLHKQALRLGGVNFPLLSPGIRVYTHPERDTPITQAQPIRFDGEFWTEFSEVLDVDN